MSNPLAAGSLSGKRVLLTGSSRGICADTINYFAEAGAKVVVNYRNKEARAKKIVDAIKANGGRAIAAQKIAAVIGKREIDGVTVAIRSLQSA